MEPGEAILAPLRFAEHKAFLQLVHSAPDGGDALYLGATLPGAIERYVTCWLPLIARESESEGEGEGEGENGGESERAPCAWR